MTDPDTEMARAIRFKFINDCEKPNVVALDRLVDNIAQALRSVRQAENEACAKVADDYPSLCMDCTDTKKVATAIRNRLQEKP